MGEPLTFGSLFAGIGGFDLGFERAGMECRWQVEIDDRCNTVLSHYWPNVQRFEDVQHVGKRNLAAVDLVCGGFPCQDVSVAGKREGLAGERSGLWFEFHRVLAELAPRWVVVENVPGLLSSNGGRDFAAVLRGLVELGYGVAWRVFDAQYWGVAQRRRRVFIVGHLGDGRAAEILFESEGSAWDSPPSRETGEGTTPLLEIGARTSGDGYRDGDGIGEDGDPMFTLQAGKVHGVAATLNSGGNDGGFRTEPGEHLVATFQETVPGWWNESDTGGTLRGRDWKDASPHLVATSQGYPAVLYQESQYGVEEYDTAGTLREARMPEHQMVRVADGQADAQCVAFAERSRGDGRNLETQEELAYALTNPGSGGRTHSRQIAGGFGIRRLTPRECERLQGFPDDFTLVDGMSDSARYRMLGNAVAVPVAEWIGRRIVAVEEGR